MEEWIYTNNRFTTNDFTNDYANSIYEVIRLEKGIPLFIEDHFERWQNSAEKLEIELPAGMGELKKIIQDLVSRNNKLIGNIKIELQIFQNDQKNLWLGFIQHNYPSDEQYKKGVSLLSYPIERENPHVKQSVVNDSIRQEIADLKGSTGVYEVLLINQQNQVTEGSRSNILFVKGNNLVSCPTSQILEGITRKKVLELCNKSPYHFIEETIDYNRLDLYEACFITGTSPKVLPVAEIDNLHFEVNNPTIIHFMKSYNVLIDDYCKYFIW